MADKACDECALAGYRSCDCLAPFDEASLDASDDASHEVER